MKKWVLVRVASSHRLFVLERRDFEHFQSLGMHKNAEVVARSDDRDELVRFQNLTEEN